MKNPEQVVFGGPWRPAMRPEMGTNPRGLLDNISTDPSSFYMMQVSTFSGVIPKRLNYLA